MDKKTETSYEPLSPLYAEGESEVWEGEGGAVLSWYKRGTLILHRIGGPAVLRKDGSRDYYIDGALYTQEDYNFVMRCYGWPEDTDE